MRLKSYPAHTLALLAALLNVVIACCAPGGILVLPCLAPGQHDHYHVHARACDHAGLGHDLCPMEIAAGLTTDGRQPADPPPHIHLCDGDEPVIRIRSVQEIPSHLSIDASTDEGVMHDGARAGSEGLPRPLNVRNGRPPPCISTTRLLI